MKHPKVSVLGCGYWGKNLVRNLYELEVLDAVCDTTEAGRALSRISAPGCKIVDNIDAVLGSDADAVVIATPAETHFDLARRALLADKDVFVEKPLTLSWLEGRQLVDLARARDRILMVGHVLEYHPGILKLRELVTSGELGSLRYIYSNRLSLGKIRREENILWSFAPHDIAIILRLTGRLPMEVMACGGAYISANVADVTVTNLLFDNGVRSHIFVSWLHPFKEQRLVVVGSRKMASFDDVGKRLMVYDQHVDWKNGVPVPVQQGGSEIAYPADEPLRLECQAFLRSIESRQKPLTDGESGVAVLKVLEAAQRSLAMNGQNVTLPMETHA